MARTDAPGYRGGVGSRCLGLDQLRERGVRTLSLDQLRDGHPEEGGDRGQSLDAGERIAALPMRDRGLVEIELLRKRALCESLCKTKFEDARAERSHFATHPWLPLHTSLLDQRSSFVNSN